MKQQKLEQLRDIIARLEEILEQSQLQSPEFQFQLYPTFQPESMYSSSDKSSNILEEQATQEQTKNEMQIYIDTDFRLAQFDYTRISNELKKMLCNDFEHLNMEYIANISENITKYQTPYTIILENQLNLVRSAIQSHQICNKTITDLTNIKIQKTTKNHNQLLNDTCDIREWFYHAISSHRIDDKILKPQELGQFTLISEQQKKIIYTQKMIEEVISQFL